MIKWRQGTRQAGVGRCPPRLFIGSAPPIVVSNGVPSKDGPQWAKAFKIMLLAVRWRKLHGITATTDNTAQKEYLEACMIAKEPEHAPPGQ